MTVTTEAKRARAPHFSSAEFRTALGMFATGVTIVTARAPDGALVGLDLRRSRPIDDDHAEVEFVARSKLGGRAQRLHEVSRFVRDDGRWYYVDGDLK